MAAKKRTGTRCSICGRPQWESPGGVTCDNGHGGAEALGAGLDARAVLDELVEGDEVLATAGRETFCPVRYHAFDVGPFSVQTTVRAGETGAAAYARARGAAQAMFDREFEEKSRGHLGRIREASELAQRSRG